MSSNAECHGHVCSCTFSHQAAWPSCTWPAKVGVQWLVTPQSCAVRCVDRLAAFAPMVSHGLGGTLDVLPGASRALSPADAPTNPLRVGLNREVRVKRLTFDLWACDACDLLGRLGPPGAVCCGCSLRLLLRGQVAGPHPFVLAGGAVRGELEAKLTGNGLSWAQGK